MPVWHEAVKEWRDRDELIVVGITQEQHPERCALFRQWQEFDWPILWDPFNLSGAIAVPNFTAVDEHGVVRRRNAALASFEADFLRRDFEPPGERSPEPPAPAYLEELRRYLAAAPDQRDADVLVAALEQALAATPDDPALRFRLGVAYRLRHDSTARRPGDFQLAVDWWRSALAARPDQYIWRRRIQQYGPRMDKPYPFYSWIEQARHEIVARGQEPIALPVSLAAAERAEPRRAFAAEVVAGEEPDPSGGVPADPGFILLDPVTVAATGATGSLLRVYLVLRPDPARGVSWDNAAGPLQVWLEEDALPTGTLLEQRLLVHPSPDAEHSTEERSVEWELSLPPGAGAGVLEGYAVYGVCEEETGACRWLRRDFRVPYDPR